MAAPVPAATTEAAPRHDYAAALKEAGFAALITFGLCIPIIAWGTRQNMDNVLVLDPRWDAVAWAVAIVFVGRFVVALAEPDNGWDQHKNEIWSLIGLECGLVVSLVAAQRAREQCVLCSEPAIAPREGERLDHAGRAVAPRVPARLVAL